MGAVAITNQPLKSGPILQVTARASRGGGVGGAGGAGGGGGVGGSGWGVFSGVGLLLRTAGVAVGAGRLGLALLMLALVMVMDRSWAALVGGPRPGPLSALVLGMLDALGWAVRGFANGRIEWAGEHVRAALIQEPAELVYDGSIRWAGLLGLLVVGSAGGAVIGVLGGAIARSAACELGPGLAVGWPTTLGFALARWRRLAGLVIGPVVLLWGACGLLWLLGRGSALPGLDVLTAVLWPLWLLAGVVVAAGALAWVVGQVMLPAAVASDDADGFEAVQRVLGYVLNRPVRVVVSWTLLALVGWLALTLWQLLLTTALGLASGWTGLPPTEAVAGEAGWTRRASANIAGVWAALPLMLAAAYAISLYFTGGAALYLSLRQAFDGEHPEEVWMPGRRGGGVSGAPGELDVPEDARAGLVDEAVPGADVDEQARRVAGALAEQGVPRLVHLRADGVMVALAVRETDLPGLLKGMSEVEEVRSEEGLRIRRRGTGLRWCVEQAERAGAWREVLAKVGGV